MSSSVEDRLAALEQVVAAVEVALAKPDPVEHSMTDLALRKAIREKDKLRLELAEAKAQRDGAVQEAADAVQEAAVLRADNDAMRKQWEEAVAGRVEMREELKRARQDLGHKPQIRLLVDGVEQYQGDIS